MIFAKNIDAGETMMQQEKSSAEEPLWLVLYVEKSAGESEQPGHAIFAAADEEQVRQKLVGWQQQMGYEVVLIHAIDPLQRNTLVPLPFPLFPTEPGKR
jgi:hypothetical protein